MMVKFYLNGIQFYEENKVYIEMFNSEHKFLKEHIESIQEFSVYNYCIKVCNDTNKIFALCNKNEGLLIIGDHELCDELASIIFISNLQLSMLKGNIEICDKFKLSYSKYGNENIRRALFAGGCFWCIASNFYDLDGVVEVYSGYASGTTFFPSYMDVKSGKTGHKESIMIIYDSSKIQYKKILKVFFENIDPFDGEGQFIDRGSSYQTAVFTDEKNEINCYENIKNTIESKYNKEIMVPLLRNCVFFLAEDEHQKFSIYNKERFEEEEQISGRNDFEKIVIE